MKTSEVKHTEVAFSSQQTFKKSLDISMLVKISIVWRSSCNRFQRESRCRHFYTIVFIFSLGTGHSQRQIL